MAQGYKVALRPLTDNERAALETIARASTERAGRVARAKIVLAVASGTPFGTAAWQSGRRSPRAVATLVGRFNAEGVVALEPRHGGGPPRRYGPEAYARILREVRRSPDREVDGTATWSLTTLQRALHRAPDGLPGVSTWTILQALWSAGYTWQACRTWCDTGTVRRKRKAGVVTVTDPEAVEKRGPSSGRRRRPRRSASRCGRRTRRGRTRPSRSRVPPGSPPDSRRGSPTSTSVVAPPSC